MTLIEVDAVTKTFKRVNALNNVSLTLESGQIFGFLGPNGAGKSTMIRCIMGFIYPNQGTITVNGQKVDSNNCNYRTQIGYVPADLQLNEKWTGEQHFEFVSKTRQVELDIQDYVERLSFDPTKQVKYLSTGNKQKLAFLLAVFIKPKILILDEPTKGLDPIFQEEMYDMLIDFRNEGNSVFFSSHNLYEVERLCDRIAIIRKGEIVTSETMESIHAKQVHVAKVRTSSVDNFSKIALYGEVISQIGDTLSIRIQGDINPFVRAVSEIDLIDFSIEHASLEEVFMNYYQGVK